MVDLFFAGSVLGILVSLIGAYFSIMSWKSLSKMKKSVSFPVADIKVVFQLFYLAALSFTSLIVLLTLDYVLGYSIYSLKVLAVLFLLVTSVVMAFGFKLFKELVK